MSRLPQPGGDDGTWGNVLNDFLSVEHNPDGSLKSSGSLSSKASLASPTFTGTVTVPTPSGTTDAATKAYVDATVSAGTPDADASTKGKLRLTGDLGGTATTPTVPGLTGKTDKSTLTTKGDIYVATASATLARLGVGSNYQELLADSATSTGLKWARKSIVSVVDYGALGDGTTDDATAIQACINASLPGDVIMFPATGAGASGVTIYLVGADIILKPGRAYAGPIAPPGSQGVTIKYKSGTNGTAVLLSEAYTSNLTFSGEPIRVENLSINGNKAGNSSGHGIMLMNYNSSISHCNFSNPAGAGIVFTDTNSIGGVITGTMSDLRIESCGVFQAGSYGIWIKDTSASGCIVDGLIQDCKVQYSQNHGIYVQRSQGWYINGNHSVASYNDGIKLQNCFNTFVESNYIDGFGANTSVVTAIGINVDSLLAGRRCVVSNNNVSAGEAAHSANSFIYYRVANQTTGLTTYIQFDNNIAYSDTTGGVTSVGLSLQPVSGVLHFYEQGSQFNGKSTTIGTPGTVHRQDLDGRRQGFMETMTLDGIDNSGNSPSPGAGTLAMTYFTADQTMTVSSLMTASRATQQSGATLAKMCLFAIDPSTGDGTCVARTASDTTLWQTAATGYTKAIADDGQGGSVSSVQLIQGRRYAFGVLHVGSSVAPTLCGKAVTAGLIAGSGPTTRRMGYLTSQTDVPTSFLGTTIVSNNSSGGYYYGRMI